MPPGFLPIKAAAAYVARRTRLIEQLYSRSNRAQGFGTNRQEVDRPPFRLRETIQIGLIAADDFVYTKAGSAGAIAFVGLMAAEGCSNGGSDVTGPPITSADTTAPSVAREMRGVWIATVANIDWPSVAKSHCLRSNRAELVRHSHQGKSSRPQYYSHCRSAPLVTPSINRHSSRGRNSSPEPRARVRATTRSRLPFRKRTHAEWNCMRG